MKFAVDMNGKRHPTVDMIQEGVAGGWRLVFFRDGTEERMTCTELANRFGVDPFRNVNPLHWEV